MLLAFAIAVYAVSIIAANLIVAALGPWVSPINSFFLIGLDLTLRDWLHIRLRPWQMLVLIAATGALTYILNPAAGQIAIASSVAFTVAALVDWGSFATLRGSWLLRSNESNVASAAVDSVLFPTIAFGVFLPWIVLGQFAAKVGGGFVWALLLSRRSPA